MSDKTSAGTPKTPPQDVKQPETPKLLQVFGPGLITGASDDDPSGIATYSQALFWSAVINGVVAVPVMTMMMMLASRRA